MLRKFAEELKDERLKQDITLQQISSRSRIDMKFLEAIENGNFEVLPEVYLKAFIKDYAKQIGLDPDVVIRKYEAAKAGKQYDEKNSAGTESKRKTEEKKPAADTEASREEPVYPHPHERIPEPARERKMRIQESDSISSSDDTPRGGAFRTNIIILSIAAAVIIIALAVYFLVIRSSSIEIVTEKPYEEVLSDNKERFETEDTVQQAPAAQTQVRNDSLDLVIKTSERTWVRVIPDDSRPGFEFVLDPQSQKLVKAKKYFRVIIGNSGGTELSLDGKPLSFEGIKGRSRTISIDSTGAVKYVRAESRKKQDSVKSPD